MQPPPPALTENNGSTVIIAQFKFEQPIHTKYGSLAPKYLYIHFCPLYFQCLILNQDFIYVACEIKIKYISGSTL